MTDSQQFVTFRCGAYSLALPADRIRHLTFAQKHEAILTQKDFSISSFRSGDEIFPAVELFDSAAAEQRVPVIRIDTADGLLAICATQILDLHRSAHVQTLPLYTENEIAACFSQGFRWNQCTYHVLDETALLQLTPQELLQSKDTSNSVPRRDNRISVRQKYWLSYQLNRILNEKISGRIELKTNERSACLSFTAGHLTYAQSDQKYGREALRAIAANKDWRNARWHDDEMQDDHNISENLIELIADSNPSHAQ